MRLIKLALISFVVFFIVFTAISLLIPSHIRISKAINLPANDSEILSQIRDTTQWSQWHPAFMQEGYSRTTAQQQITLTKQTDTDSLIEMRMTRIGKHPILNGWQLHRYTTTDSLTLQWYMDFHLPWYPWQKFGSLLYESTYGKMMEVGLGNLKKEASSQPTITPSADSINK